MAKSGGFCSEINSVEYYFQMDRDAALAKGLNPHEVDAEGNVRPGGANYYADNGAGDSLGRWFNPGRAETGSEGELTQGLHGSLLMDCAHGENVNSMQLRAFSLGIDPSTMTRLEDSGLLDPKSGTRLLESNKRGEKKGKDPAPGGYDLMMAPPKDVSFIGLTDDQAGRDAFVNDHQEAFGAAMQWAWDRGYFVHRKMMGGIQEYVPVKEAAIARFTHFTSRADDPQIHDHAAIMKMAVAQDGTVVTLDNRLLRQHSGAINAIYRTELVARLKMRMPYRFIRDGEQNAGRNFQIDGFPAAARELFSKRRAQILEGMKELEKDWDLQPGTLDTATHREAAQNLAYNTRSDKTKTPLLLLVDRWHAELKIELDISRADIVKYLEAEAFLARQEAIESGALKEEAAETRKARLIELAAAEIDQLLTRNTTLKHAQMLRAVGEALQVHATGADEVMAIVEAIKADFLIPISEDRIDSVWTTQALWDKEVGVLRTAFERQDEFDFVQAHFTEQALAEFTPTEEQAAAVRHALNRDGISLVQGAAGTGKSYATKIIRVALEAANRRVFGTAPSWVATEVLSKESGIAAGNVMVLAKLLHEYRAGNIEFKKGDAVILDEAGMVDLHDMAEIVEMASIHGLKLILQGDIAQYRPVGAGAPFEALQKVIKAVKLEQIVRQKGRTDDEREWMRAASIDLASHEPGKGINKARRAFEAYDKAGMLTWSGTEDDAVAATVDKWMKHRLKRPGEDRAILTEHNTDARQISASIRARLFEEDLLGDEAVTFTAIPRGTKAAAMSLELRAGDEIIFGENVQVNGLQIRNADKARVTAVEAGSNANDPILTLHFYKGGEITARVSELVGFRAQDDEGNPGEPAMPKVQHCYAMTGHSMQGVTIDYAISLHLNSRGSNGAYVGATRHRHQLDIVIATERIRDELALDGIADMGIAEAGGLVKAREERDEVSSPSRDKIKDKFYAEIGGSDPTGNVTDTLNEKQVFAAIGHPLNTIEPQTKAETLAVRMRQREMAPKGYKAQSVVPRRLGALWPRLSAIPAIPTRSASPSLSSAIKPNRALSTAAIIRANWQQMLSGANDYLIRVRGILPEVLKLFQSDIKTEPKVAGNSWFRPGNVSFAHRDMAGNMVGFERLGEGFGGPGDLSFSEMAHGSDKRLTMMGDRQNPRTIIVGELGVEALSKFQMQWLTDDKPAGHGHLLCSSFGMPADEALAQFSEIAAKWQDARIVLAMNNDRAGELFIAKFRQAVIDGRGSDAGLSIEYPDGVFEVDEKGERTYDKSGRLKCHPEHTFKDWNDQLRGHTIRDAAIRSADAKPELEQQSANERQSNETSLLAQGKGGEPTTAKEQTLNFES